MYSVMIFISWCGFTGAGFFAGATSWVAGTASWVAGTSAACLCHGCCTSRVLVLPACVAVLLPGLLVLLPGLLASSLLLFLVSMPPSP